MQIDRKNEQLVDEDEEVDADARRPVEAEAKLFCVVCSVPRPGDPPVQGDYVEERVHHSIKRIGYG